MADKFVTYASHDTKIYHLFPDCSTGRGQKLLRGAQEYTDRVKINKLCKVCQKRQEKEARK